MISLKADNQLNIIVHTHMSPASQMQAAEIYHENLRANQILLKQHWNSLTSNSWQKVAMKRMGSVAKTKPLREKPLTPWDPTKQAW